MCGLKSDSPAVTPAPTLSLDLTSKNAPGVQARSSLVVLAETSQIDGVDLAVYPAPPIPPEGALDLRWVRENGESTFRDVVGDWDVKASWWLAWRAPAACSARLSVAALDHLGSGVLLYQVPGEAEQELAAGVSIDLGTAGSGRLRVCWSDRRGLGEIPTMYQLVGNQPNPFNPMTTIEFGVPRAGRVRLVIYDLHGRRVATALDGHVEAGYHEVTWNGRSDRGAPVASGVYFYQMVAPGFTETRKMTVLK